MNTASTHNLDETHEKVKGFLSYLKEDVDNANTLVELGAYTKLAKDVETFITNPLESMIQTYIGLTLSIQKMLSSFVRSFLQSNKGLIDKVYETSVQNSLMYYVVLKEDTMENRAVFFKFLDAYEGLEIDQNISIRFQFVPQRVLDKITLENEIALN